MIDTFAILFSTLMVAFVLIRVLKMDSREPWFRPTPYEQPSDRGGTRAVEKLRRPASSAPSPTPSDQNG